METEIKLIPSHTTQAKIRASMRQGDERRVLEEVKKIVGLSGCEIVAAGIVNIVDDYWDTPALDLYRAKAGFRLRSGPKGQVLYAKTSGTRVDGHFERDEIELKLSSDEALRGIYTAFQQQRREILPQHADKLFQNVIRVNNQRWQFLLKRRDEEYELSIDFFHYSTQRFARTSTVLSEIELEALNSPARSKIGEIADLMATRLPGAKPSKDSKYERGIKKLHLTYPEWTLRLFESVDTLSIKWILALVSLTGLALTIMTLK